MTVHGPEEFEPDHRARVAILAGEADAVVAISAWCAAEVRALCETHVPAIAVIGMGVDEDYLAPPTPILANGPILCLARLDRRKGHKTLFGAIRSLRERHPTMRIELVGDGPLRKQLEDEVIRLQLSESVAFCGWLDQAAVLRKLNLARFVVLPSLSEGLPVAIMEAFSRARPVIATRVAAVSELVNDRVNGLLVEPGSTDALASAIEMLHAAPAERLFEMGNAGRRIVAERFDAARNARALAALWSRLPLSGS